MFCKQLKKRLRQRLSAKTIKQSQRMHNPLAQFYNHWMTLGAQMSTCTNRSMCVIALGHVRIQAHGWQLFLEHVAKGSSNGQAGHTKFAPNQSFFAHCSHVHSSAATSVALQCCDNSRTAHALINAQLPNFQLAHALMYAYNPSAYSNNLTLFACPSAKLRMC